MVNFLNNMTDEEIGIVQSRNKFVLQIDLSIYTAQKIRAFLIGSIDDMRYDARYLKFCKASIIICEDLADLVYQLKRILPEECRDINVDLNKFEFTEVKSSRVIVDSKKTGLILFKMRHWVDGIGDCLDLAKTEYPQTKFEKEDIIQILNEMYSKLNQLHALLDEFNIALRELENFMNLKFNF